MSFLLHSVCGSFARRIRHATGRTRREVQSRTRIHLFEALETRNLLAWAAQIGAPEGDDMAGYAEAERYAVLGEDVARAEAALTEMGLPKIKSFKHFSGLAVQLTEAQAAALRMHLGSGFRILPDQPYPAFDEGGIAAKPGGGSGGGGQETPWGIAAVNAPAAWSTTRGAGVAVCVVDTGLDIDHPDLASNIRGGENYISGGSWDDDHGHGTHVGGTIAAIDNTIGVVGVAPQATLLASKVFNQRGVGTNTDIAEGILGCLSLRQGVNPDMPLVINMSFVVGGSDLELVHDAINQVRAIDPTVVLVAAAGNFGSNDFMARPARWDGVLGISGIEEDLSFWPESSSGGAEGHRNPDFTAPAADVLSLTKGGRTKVLSGTSMSAAHASGVIALGLSMPNFLGPVGRDIGLPDTQQGQGLIDALLTVQHVEPLASMTVVSIQAAIQLVDVSMPTLANTLPSLASVGEARPEHGRCDWNCGTAKDSALLAIDRVIDTRLREETVEILEDDLLADLAAAIALRME
jgi:hypothetical protein